MGQEEKIDSDMGHGSFKKIDMATWAFLEIDMGHAPPPPSRALHWPA